MGKRERGGEGERTDRARGKGEREGRQQQRESRGSSNLGEGRVLVSDLLGAALDERHLAVGRELGHSAGTPSPSLLRHLLKGEGGAAAV